MLAARWTGMDLFGARTLMLDTASLSILGYEHTTAPAIRLWNDTHHLLSDHKQHTYTDSLLIAVRATI
jgi:hypothetical protein